MTRIILAGRSSGGGYRLDAFIKPSPGEEVLFHTRTEETGYYPHLVRVFRISEKSIWFRGVNLDSPYQEFGPDDTANSYYKVNRLDRSEVYDELPSTLTGLQVDGARCHVILFLSDKFKDGNDPSELLKLKARGAPKWPEGAGRLLQLEGEIGHLKDAQKKTIQELTKIVENTSLDASLAPALRRLIVLNQGEPQGENDEHSSSGRGKA